MPNAVLNPSIIAKEALVQLENSLVMGNLVHRDYRNEFVKVGDTISVRRPVHFTARDGATLQKQDVTEGKTTITIDQRKHVAWAFNSQELTLTIEEYSERYIKPAMIELAQQVETSLTGLYVDVNEHVGTPGTTPGNFAALAAAAQRMDEGAVPSDMRYLVMNPAAAWSVADSLTKLFMPNRAERALAASTALEMNSLGPIAGFDAYKSQTVQAHTVGALGGTPLVNGASQSVTYEAVKDTMVSTLVTDGWTSAAATRLRKGDVITLDGVFAVNPRTRQSTGVLRRFTVTADAASDASGNMTISIYPAIITSGAYQTVTAAPANDAPITVVTGTANAVRTQNIAFHRNAFALVNVPLQMPEGVSFKARETYNGLSVRVIKDYDMVNDEEVIRLDILYGVKTIDPRLAVRLTG